MTTLRQRMREDLQQPGCSAAQVTDWLALWVDLCSLWCHTCLQDGPVSQSSSATPLSARDR